MDLNGKVAIVTGAGSGIGHAITERLSPDPPIRGERIGGAVELAPYKIRGNNVAPGRS